jgi:hypothetical protein
MDANMDRFGAKFGIYVWRRGGVGVNFGVYVEANLSLNPFLGVAI